jgi:hypothetical protein
MTIKVLENIEPKFALGSIIVNCATNTPLQPIITLECYNIRFLGRI